MTRDRWSQHSNHQYLSPDAIKLAQTLETEGYTQHDIDELLDGEHVMVVAAHNGAHAPARYLKAGKPVGDSGERECDVLVSFPDSPFEDRIEYKDTLHEPIEGEKVSRVGIFRPSLSHHQAHMQGLYDARRQMHAQEARSGNVT